MSLDRLQSDWVFRSVYGQSTYRFTIGMAANGVFSVKDILTPQGPVSSTVGLPEPVLVDIQSAIGQMGALLNTTAFNGTATFANQTYRDVSFPSPVGTTSYRVVFSVEDFLVVRVTNKTVNGFRIEVSQLYTGTVGFDVFV